MQLRPACPEGVGQREQDAADFFLLLLLERHDVVVDFDRAQRLEEQARAARGAAMDDAGDRRAVFRADDEYVAAVAVGDDLLLQVLRGVLAAQVRLERAAQARPLFPESIAEALQLGTGVVRHLARGVDLATDVGDLALERRGPFDHRAEQRERRPVATDAGDRRVDGREERGEPDQVQRFERAPLDRERGQDRVERGGGAERDLAGAGQKTRTLRRGRKGGRHRARVDERLEAREAGGARRRLREPYDGIDDPIEFEGLEGTGLHLGRRLDCSEAQSISIARVLGASCLELGAGCVDAAPSTQFQAPSTGHPGWFSLSG